MCGCYIFLVWFLLLPYASTSIFFTTNNSDLLTSDNDFDVPNVTVYPEISQRSGDDDDNAIISSRYNESEVMQLKSVLQNNSYSLNNDTTRMLSGRKNTTCEQSNTSYIEVAENCSMNSNILDSIDTKDRLTSLKKTIAATNKVFMYILPFIYIPGLTLGITGLRIYLKENKKNKASFSMTYFLFTISVSLVLSMVKYIVYNISVFFQTSVWLNIGRWTVLISYYHLGKVINWMVFSQYATVAINSFVSTAFPFYVRRFPLAQNPKRVTIILLTICLLFGLLNVPRQTVMVTQDEITGVNYIPVYTDLGNQHKKLFDLYGFFTTVLLTMIPIILTTVFYLLIIAALVKSRKRAPVSDKIQRSKERTTRRLTRIFSVLIAIKLITTYPCLIYVMSKGFTFTAKDDESSVLGLFVFNVVQYVADITHGISSAIFIFMSSSFRKELYRLYSCWKTKETDSTGLEKTDTKGSLKTDSTGSSKTDSTGSSKTDSTGSSKTGSTGSSKTDSTGSAKTDSTGSAKTDSTGSAKTDSTGSSETDSTGSAKTDSTGSAKTDSTGSMKTDSTGSSKTDSTGSSKTDSMGSSKTDSTGSSKTDSTGLAKTDSTGSAKTDSTGSAKRDFSNSK